MYTRKFTLRSTFRKISRFISQDGEDEIHFGVLWRMYAIRSGDVFGLCLYCGREKDDEKPWCISVRMTCRLENGKNKYEGSIETECPESIHKAFCSFRGWDTLIEKFVKNDELTAEIDVVIQRMEGIVPKRKRSFDAPEEHMTDVVPAIGNRKFHVSKVILAAFGDFFKPLFFSGYKEAKQSKIELKEVDPDVFQVFLEVIYGDSKSINESTVEDLLHVARRYQVGIVTQRCAEFMIIKADVDLDMKFRLASTYDLQDLQDHLIEGINSKKESEERLDRSVRYMSDSFIVKMIRKVYE